MERKIAICIGSDRAGNVRARLSLMLVEGENVLTEHYHSAMLAPGDDPAEVRSRVEAHIAMPTDKNGIPAAPWPAIPDEEWAKVTGAVAIFHKPEAVAKISAGLAAKIASVQSQRMELEAEEVANRAAAESAVRARNIAEAEIEAARKAAREVDSIKLSQ